MTGTLVVVQARYGSSRLPGKALYPLAGRPMLAYLLERMRSNAWRLCLATTTNPEDDALAVWGGMLGVDVVRGEDQDVLTRYVRCLDAFDPAVVVRVTGDNPLTCPELVAASARAVAYGVDYAALPEGCPVGLGADAFSASALKSLAQEAQPGPEREHINLRIVANSSAYNVARPEIAESFRRPDLRLTVDTLDDYRAMVRLVDSLPGSGLDMGLKEIVARHASRS